MMRTLVTCIVVMLACVIPGHAHDIAFDKLLANPERFDKQKVTVTGLFEVGGNYNLLWRDSRAKRGVDFKGLIFLIPNGQRPFAEQFPYVANLRSARVSGVFVAKARVSFHDEHVAMLQQDVQVLAGPRQKEFLPILAWFQNDSGTELKFEFEEDLAQGGSIGSLFKISAHRLTETAVEKGTVTVTFRTRLGKPYAKAALPISASGPYYDRTKHAYFFRIAKNKIEPVRPEDVRNWRFYSIPGRD